MLRILHCAAEKRALFCSRCISLADCMKITAPRTAQEQLGLTDRQFEHDSESQHNVIQEILEDVSDVLPRECFLAWKSKAKSKMNTFKQEPK